MCPDSPGRFSSPDASFEVRMASGMRRGVQLRRSVSPCPAVTLAHARSSVRAQAVIATLRLVLRMVS